MTMAGIYILFNGRDCMPAHKATLTLCWGIHERLGGVACEHAILAVFCSLPWGPIGWPLIRSTNPYRGAFTAPIVAHRWVTISWDGTF
jgi:hypothetical protein